MKGGARRKTIACERPPSPPPDQLQNEIDLHGNDEVEYNKQNREEEQQKQQRNGGDGGNEFDEEEEEDYEEYDDQFNYLEVDGGGAGGGESKGDVERPKLAEGFFEIEGVRKKRIRKGETQYLIKWLGWPETSNTWEPVQNLMSCTDVIDAFEESLRSGKQRSTRKHKRKHAVAPTPQPTKNQMQKQKPEPEPEPHSPAATYAVPSVRITIIEEPLSLPSVHTSSFSNRTENHIVGTGKNQKNSKKANDNESLKFSPQTRERKENGLDVKLKELKGTSFTNHENMNEFAIHIQEDRPTNGVSKADGRDPVRASPRIGAKRRKSGAVKRFKQDPSQVAHDTSENTTSASDVVGQDKNRNIVKKIIKPVDYSTSVLNGAEEVSVSFSVIRSDGQETIVDNKYLKATNPLLLINFYEQHLRYNNPSE